MSSLLAARNGQSKNLNTKETVSRTSPGRHGLLGENGEYPEGHKSGGKIPTGSLHLRFWQPCGHPERSTGWQVSSQGENIQCQIVETSLYLVCDSTISILSVRIKTSLS